MLLISLITFGLLLIIWQTHRERLVRPFEFGTAKSTIPLAFGQITLHLPKVVFTGAPKGLLDRRSLANRIPMPKPHEPAVIGDAARSHGMVFQHGKFWRFLNDPVMLIIEDAFVTSENVLIQDNNYVMLTRACHPKYWEAFYRPPVSITYNYTGYESVVCVGHQHSSDFGHWFLEVLPALAALPKEVLRHSVVLLPRNGSHILDGLNLLGVNASQLVVGDERLVYAKRLYTVDMPLCGDLSSHLVLNFRKLLAQKFGLGKKEPTKFLTYNRENMSRAIGNYKELMEAVKKKWPHIQWEEAVIPKTISEQAKYFDDVKFLFCVHGSIEANLIFMQENTVVVDLQMEQWLWSFIYLSAYTGKYITVGQDPAISWRSLRPNIVDIEYVLTLIESGLRQIKAI